MSMFCFQCQEAAGNTGCTVRGMCGKLPETSGLQDLLIHVLKGIGTVGESHPDGEARARAGRFVARSLFATITNGNFDDERIREMIREAIALRDGLRDGNSAGSAGTAGEYSDAATWNGPEDRWQDKAFAVGVLSAADPDVRSLRELLIYGLKGLAAYAVHADVLGFEDQAVWDFLLEALAATTRPHSVDEMTALVLRAGSAAVLAMSVLDRANTSTYGNPEITKVNIGVGTRPGILVSGHDLHDLEALLRQTEGSGVDVYTHGEMLPAHYYPAFRKYRNFVGNYGNAWWKQDREFESFRGPILMTTNCITPVKDSYRDRIFTTGVTGYPGVRHIPEAGENGEKDFSQVIELAKRCEPPVEIETGEIVGGFAHAQVTALADKVVDAVKSGAIRRFVVMAGCDGRQKGRSYFTEVAEQLPGDTVILTAGCAKYRYNKLPLGDIGGIPRVLDAGQCNDSYSLALIALKLKDAFGLSDVNELPLSFDLAWYEQKAVAVLLALLHLGFKGIRLGPTLPAFLSPNVAKVLVEQFGIKPVGDVAADIEAMLQGA